MADEGRARRAIETGRLLEKVEIVKDMGSDRFLKLVDEEPELVKELIDAKRRRASP